MTCSALTPNAESTRFQGHPTTEGSVKENLAFGLAACNRLGLAAWHGASTHKKNSTRNDMNFEHTLSIRTKIWGALCLVCPYVSAHRFRVVRKISYTRPDKKRYLDFRTTILSTAFKSLLIYFVCLAEWILYFLCDLGYFLKKKQSYVVCALGQQTQQITA